MRTGSLWLGTFVLMAAIGTAALQTINPSHATDLFLDKYHAKEAWAGDPYQTQRQLGTKYGFWPDAPDSKSPRTPGASLILTPTALIPDAVLPWAGVLVVPLFALATFFYAGRIGRMPDRWVAVASAGYVAARPGDFVWINMTQVTTPLVVAAWWYRMLAPRAAGVLLGVAAAVKLWPAFVVVAWLCRRDSRRSGWWAVLSGGGMTALGLLLPGVSVDGAISALLAAGSYFGSSSALTNVSAVNQFGWPALLVSGALMLAAVRVHSASWGTGWAVAAALVASPVVWPHYWIATLPVLSLTISRSLRPSPIRTPGNSGRLRGSARWRCSPTERTPARNE